MEREYEVRIRVMASGPNAAVDAACDRLNAGEDPDQVFAVKESGELEDVSK